MAIIHMGFYHEGDKLVEGAYCSLNTYGGDQTKHPDYYLYETDHGCCIKEREHNGYHDSDFSMLIWNPETKTASWYTFATTRGWCYPCFGSRPDATPEVLAAYHEYEAKREADRKRYEAIKRVNKQRKLNATFRQIVRVYGVERSQVEKLYYAYSPELFPAFCKLLSANLRSEFRKSLRKQLIEWLEGRGKFDKPFSPKQLPYV